MRRESVHQESLTLGPFSLVSKGWISRYPEVVICIKMGRLETLGSGSSHRGRTRTRGSQDMDTLDHCMMPPCLGGKCRHAALHHDRFERLNFIEGKAPSRGIGRLLNEDLAVLHRLELK
jgi:hypothetical protein